MAAMDMITKPSKRRILFSLLHSCTVENKLKTEISSLGENRYKICVISDTFTKEYIHQRFATFLTRGALFRTNFYGGAP